MPNTASSSNWSATYHSGKLTVSGQYTFPTTGYSVRLKKKEPQGIHPGVLFLQQTVTDPTGVVADHIVHETVTFKEHTASKYREVEVLPDGIKIAVKAS